MRVLELRSAIPPVNESIRTRAPAAEPADAVELSEEKWGTGGRTLGLDARLAGLEVGALADAVAPEAMLVPCIAADVLKWNVAHTQQAINAVKNNSFIFLISRNPHLMQHLQSGTEMNIMRRSFSLSRHRLCCCCCCCLLVVAVVAAAAAVGRLCQLETGCSFF